MSAHVQTTEMGSLIDCLSFLKRDLQERHIQKESLLETRDKVFLPESIYDITTKKTDTNPARAKISPHAPIIERTSEFSIIFLLFRFLITHSIVPSVDSTWHNQLRTTIGVSSARWEIRL